MRFRESGGGELFFQAAQLVFKRGDDAQRTVGQFGFVQGMPGEFYGSRFVVEELMKNNKVEVAVDLKPALDEVKLDNRLIRDLDENGKRKVDNFFRMWMPASLIPLFLDELGIDGNKEAHQLTGKERRKIMLLMKDLRFTVTGYRPFREAIITAGGVITGEIDSKTMESRLVKNLYFAGEVMDLDADTGGFNLQIAFSTGWLAGTSCMNRP